MNAIPQLLRFHNTQTKPTRKKKTIPQIIHARNSELYTLKQDTQRFEKNIQRITNLTTIMMRQITIHNCTLVKTTINTTTVFRNIQRIHKQKDTKNILKTSSKRL